MNFKTNRGTVIISIVNGFITTSEKLPKNRFMEPGFEKSVCVETISQSLSVFEKKVTPATIRLSFMF